MKVYLAGSMSSRYPDRGAAAMDHHINRLRELGHEVVDPRAVGGDGGRWHAAMRRDIAALALCDAVAVAPGVADSDRGVWVEVNVALTLGIPVVGADSPWFGGAS
jgi:hypothetical protein